MKIAVTGGAAESFCRNIYKDTDNRKKLLDRYPKSFFDLYMQEKEEGNVPLFAVDFECAKDGGVFAALWRLLKRNHLGGNFSQRAIPISQQAVEICEFFGIDPYRAESENCYVLLCEEECPGITVIGETEKGPAIRCTDGESIAYLRRPEPLPEKS